MQQTHSTGAPEFLPARIGNAPITRRLFLRSASAASAVSIAAAAPATAEPVRTPRDLVDFHAAELAKAMQAIYPEMKYYEVDLEHGLVVCAVGMRRGILIGGDGIRGDLDRMPNPQG